MANKVKFNYLHNEKRPETKLLTIVMGKCPDLTLTDCNVGHGYGIINFCTTGKFESLFTNSVKEEPHKLHIEAILPKKHYVKQIIFVANVKPFITKLT